MSDLMWKIGALTDRGLHREDNQDTFFVSSDGKMMAVADGMGGAAGGALASKAAVEALERCWNESPPNTTEGQAVAVWLQQAVQQANRDVMSIPGSYEPARRPGSTIVVAIRCDDGHLCVAHVGDSRAYIFRSDRTEFVTMDHSVVMELVRAGRVTEDQARENIYKHVLTRCLGHDPAVEIEHSRAAIQDGDWIVLCSDGLCGVLEPVEILAVLKDSQTPEMACDSLLQSVLRRNAPDNITVIAARYRA